MQNEILEIIQEVPGRPCEMLDDIDKRSQTTWQRDTALLVRRSLRHCAVAPIGLAELKELSSGSIL